MSQRNPMNVLDEDEQDLSSLLCIRGNNGRAALKVGLLATMFFAEPWTRIMREAVANVAEAYIKMVGEHLRWTMQTKTARIYPLSANRVPSPGKWLPNHEDGRAWSFGLHGGDSMYDASEFQVSGFGSNNVTRNLGFIQIHLPLLWLAEYPGAFQDFVVEASRSLRPLSGYGGIGALEALDLATSDRHQPVVRLIAERFPGIEVESRTAHTIWLKDGIKGVNWLTILSDRWVEAAGGLDYLRIRLDDTFVFYPYDGGLVIQAGPKPQIGDVQANRWPRHYARLAKVLKRIQITNHRPFHLGGPGRMDKAASMAWLFRFDGK
ncbi:type VI immunity family protein [Sorangium sp. So ce124]|uniref:type VI immunity family protein n=1 Tax=Sorangium sp. So ce124 TaxID=3133280 RepID=UPI003F6077B6